MLENNSYKAPIATLALAALVLFSAGFNANAVAEEQLDKFGVEKIYPTKQSGNEWYVNMDDPKSDLRNVGNVAFEKNSDGSWHVSARQIRMEAWSPSNEKWHNVEITMYGKIDAGTSANDLLQMYSRGGHHSSRNPCDGSAYKARLYEDGRAAWTKEVTHPAYAHNRGVEQVAGELEGKWIGFKAVIYNFVQDGNTYVRLESYIDDDVTDANGNLVIKNNWKLASVVEDRGGWETPDGDFASNCGLARDAILAGPGGTGNQNLAAWRSDNIGWSFKYLSVREIDPANGQMPQPEPQPEPAPEEEIPQENQPTDLSGYTTIASQTIAQSADEEMTIGSVQFKALEETLATEGTILVALTQEDKVLATREISTAQTNPNSFTNIVASIDLGVTGSFDVVMMYQGRGWVLVNGINVTPT